MPLAGARPIDLPGSVLTLSPSRDVVAQVRRALRGTHEVRPCATVVEARALLTHGHVAALVMESVDAHGVPTAPLAKVGGAMGRLTVIALVRRAEGLTPSTLALLDTRPAAIAAVEDLDLACVARALGIGLDAAAFTVGALPPLAAVPAGLRPVLDAALAHGREPLTVPLLARTLGWHRATLWGRCRQHGVRSVEMLIVWCRLIVAARALRTGAGSVEAIAHDLGFASPSALRNLLRRYLGITATELRLGGGEAIAAQAFARWLDAQRIDAADSSDGTMRPTVTTGDAA